MKKQRYAFGALQVVQKGWKEGCMWVHVAKPKLHRAFLHIKKGKKSDNYLEIYEKPLEDFKQGIDITMFNECIIK